MSDVFVSYKAEDRPRVQPLVEALQADGLSVWWDAHIAGGDDWRESIARELDQAACVVVVWSKRSTGPDGHFVRDEATRALRRHAYLAVRIDKVDPPLGFGESQALPLAGWKGDRSDPRYTAVLNAALAMIGKPAVAGRRAGSRIDRRTLIGGGAAIAVAGGAGIWLATRDAGAASDSIAVLPFANLSGDPAQAYFSDGMAEELRNALSRIAQLKVVARTSSEMMRDTDAKTAARKLDVANILTGSVRRSASTIRVSAQLIGGRDGIELWSQSFDRPFGDVLQIQSGIAASVAEALSIRLARKERAALLIGGTKNAAAQDLLLKAMPQNNTDNEAGLNRAIGLMDAAIALDPNYAEAYARKAFALNFYSGVFAHDSADVHARQAEATALARRSLAIEPRLGLGFAALGSIYQNQLNLGGAVTMFERALSMPGTDVRVLASYSTILSQIGRTDEALRMIDKAMALDPLDAISQEVRATILYRAHRFPEAVAYARRAVAANSRRPRLLGLLVLAAITTGDYAEARRQITRLPADDMRRLTGSAFLAAHDGDRAAAERFRQDTVRRFGDAAHYQYAQIDAQLGNKDRAFAELDQAWAERDAGLASIKVDPFFDPLRNDPRFAAIVAKLNFP